MDNIVDLFRTAIEDLGQTIPINSVVDNLDGTWTLNVSKTKWLRPYANNMSRSTSVTINSVAYPITELVYDASITLTTNTDLSSFTSLTIQAPIYINGTQLMVAKDRGNVLQKWTEYPFVWLVEPFIADESKDKRSIIASTPDLTMLFLDGDNANDWSTSDRYSNVINPMDEIVEAFYQKLITTRATFGRVTSWKVIRHAKFGKQAENGHIHSIIDEKTSGVELRFSVEILKKCNC
jgi:hypothetical protein